MAEAEARLLGGRIASQQMGHSAKVHSELYHHWISERHHQRAFELMMTRSERPIAPTVLGHKKQ